MWAKVDDHLDEHHKVFIAGARLGLRQTGRVLAIWLEGRLWTNRMNTQGFLPTEAVAGFRHDRLPLKVAEALSAPITDQERAQFRISSTHCLWEKVKGGYQIHNDEEYRPRPQIGEDLREKRRQAGRRGGLKSGETRRSQGSTVASIYPESKQKTKLKTNPVSRYQDLRTINTGVLPSVPVLETPEYKERAGALPRVVENTETPQKIASIRAFRRQRSHDGRPKVATIAALVRHLLLAPQPPEIETEEDLVEHVRHLCAREANLAYDTASIVTAIAMARGQIERPAKVRKAAS